MGLLDGLLGRRPGPQQGFGFPQQGPGYGPVPSQQAPGYGVQQGPPVGQGPGVSGSWPAPGQQAPGYGPPNAASQEDMVKEAERQRKAAHKRAVDMFTQNPEAWIPKRLAAWEARGFAVKGQWITLIAIVAGLIGVVPPLNYVSAAVLIAAGAFFLLKFKPYVDHTTARYGF